MLADIALIPARGGSKGLPGKNIAPLIDKPLITYTIDAALRSNVFKRVVVSTDDTAIANISLAAGAEVLNRPAILSQDNSSSLDVIEHALSEYELTSGCFCLLQPTSPLRNALHIQEAAAQFFESTATSVISAHELNHHPLKSLIIREDGIYIPIRKWDDLVASRQSLPKAIAPNGAIYFCDIECFRNEQRLFFPNTLFYLMSIRDSVDIDSYDDLIYASELLSKKEFHFE